MPFSPDENVLRAFAAEVKARRGVLGISQEELAFRAGMNRTFIAKMELAKNQPTLTSLFRLANGLETEAGELLAAVQVRYEIERYGI
jgi:transcriptional regulator with XRE-family HTH domain